MCPLGADALNRPYYVRASWIPANPVTMTGRAAMSVVAVQPPTALTTSNPESARYFVEAFFQSDVDVRGVFPNRWATTSANPQGPTHIHNPCARFYTCTHTDAL